MATAELAVAMPVLLFVLALGLSALSAGADHIRCVDAARTGARLLARGEPSGTAAAAAGEVAPPGAAVSMTSVADQVVVSVTAPPAAGLAWLGLTVRPQATATAAREDALTGDAK